MNESAILDALESIANRVDAIAAMTIATFMLIAAILVYVMLNYNKK